MLCTECRDELSTPLRISPEQIVARGEQVTSAVLLDSWGRAHRLSALAPVGRHIEGDGVMILEPSISRSHADLVLEGATWTLHDRGSVNGSYVNDQLVEGALAIADRGQVRFGEVAFYFLADGAGLRATERPNVSTTMIPKITADAAPPPLHDGNEFRDEPTDPGLPSLVVKLHQPTGGGGGLIQIDGAQLQVTTPQYEMMELMVQRMEGEADRPALLRGFVRSAELITRLSWDTTRPNDNHVKQLVRRMRRTLIRSGIGDLIESRHRFGYRLRATPRDR